MWQGQRCELYPEPILWNILGKKYTYSWLVNRAVAKNSFMFHKVCFFQQFGVSEFGVVGKNRRIISPTIIRNGADEKKFGWISWDPKTRPTPTPTPTSNVFGSNLRTSSSHLISGWPELVLTFMAFGATALAKSHAIKIIALWKIQVTFPVTSSIGSERKRRLYKISTRIFGLIRSKRFLTGVKSKQKRKVHQFDDELFIKSMNFSSKTLY